MCSSNLRMAPNQKHLSSELSRLAVWVWRDSGCSVNAPCSVSCLIPNPSEVPQLWVCLSFSAEKVLWPLWWESPWTWATNNLNGKILSPWKGCANLKLHMIPSNLPSLFWLQGEAKTEYVPDSTVWPIGPAIWMAVKFSFNLWPKHWKMCPEWFIFWLLTLFRREVVP